MKAKLIKNNSDGWVHYYLKNENGITIGTTKYPFPPELNRIAKSKEIELSKLSLKNCQAIEVGYDLDELADKHIKEWEYERLLGGGSATLAHDNFVIGFQKALKLMGDELFNWLSKNDYLTDDKDIIIKEYYRQNEWDVYTETEPMNIDEIREQGKGFLNTNINKSKLDVDGCLILKRI